MACELYETCEFRKKTPYITTFLKDYEIALCKGEKVEVEKCEYRKVLIERDNLKKIIEEGVKKIKEINTSLTEKLIK